jgi:hypothetical protein
MLKCQGDPTEGTPVRLRLFGKPGSLGSPPATRGHACLPLADGDAQALDHRCRASLRDAGNARRQLASVDRHANGSAGLTLLRGLADESLRAAAAQRDARGFARAITALGRATATGAGEPVNTFAATFITTDIGVDVGGCSSVIVLIDAMVTCTTVPPAASKGQWDPEVRALALLLADGRFAADVDAALRA